MKMKTYTNRRTLKNTNCFECKVKMEAVLAGDVCLIINAYPYYFHSKCARKILSAHVVDAIDRDSWAEKKIGDRKRAEELANTLGFHTHPEIALDYQKRKDGD